MIPDPRYSAFDLLDVPILVFGREKVIYANEAAGRMLRIDAAVLVGQPAGDLTARFMPPDVARQAAMRVQQIAGGQSAPGQAWIRLGGERPEVSVFTRSSDGFGPGERIHMVIEVPSVENARRLTEALARGGQTLHRAQTEEEVLTRALEVLQSQGYSCSSLLVRGDVLVHGPTRYEPALVEKFAAVLAGRPISRIDYPMSKFPELVGAKPGRGATFHADIFDNLVKLYPPDVLAALDREGMPHVAALDAPIFAEGTLYGVLIAVSDKLSPDASASIELFAGLVGSAIEVVRGQQRAAERLRELQRLQKELVQQERLAVLGEAAAVVSHEVRNPLGTIINGVVMLRRDRGLSADSGRVVGMIEEEAHRLNRLVANLLEFVRPLEARPRAVELATVARRAMENWAPGVGEVNVPVEFRETSADAVVETDPEMLQLALHNLIRNAVQMTPRDGKVRLSVVRDETGAALAVDDEGPGVRDEDLQKIFAPFFTTRATGTGLGLAVVERVVRTLSARIEVSRSPEGGARFLIRFGAAPS